jgi:glutamate/aspartate transport system substrate-binding protein
MRLDDRQLERRKLGRVLADDLRRGTKLLVRRGSPIKSFRDLGGRTVVVTAGTTNEKAMQEIARRFKLDFKLATARDHAESYAQLEAGKADAFATDDVLLYGLVAQHKAQKKYQVIGEFLSYDPYGVMFRKDDTQLAALVKQAFHDLARTAKSSASTSAGSSGGCRRPRASTCR